MDSDERFGSTPEDVAEVIAMVRATLGDCFEVSENSVAVLFQLSPLRLLSSLKETVSGRHAAIHAIRVEIRAGA